MDTVRVMISLPRALLEVVDRAATEEHRSRSEFLREAARFYVERGASGRRPIDDPAVREAVNLMDQLARQDRLDSPGWDAAEAVRETRWRRHDG